MICAATVKSQCTHLSRYSTQRCKLQHFSYLSHSCFWIHGQPLFCPSDSLPSGTHLDVGFCFFFWLSGWLLAGDPFAFVRPVSLDSGSCRHGVAGARRTERWERGRALQVSEGRESFQAALDSCGSSGKGAWRKQWTGSWGRRQRNIRSGCFEDRGGFISFLSVWWCLRVPMSSVWESWLFSLLMKWSFSCSNSLM